MTCRKCEHGTAKKFGKTAAGTGRYRCRDCGATFTEPKPTNPLGVHTTDLSRVEQLVTLLTEGMSIRAASRVTGIHKTTILALLVTIGMRCAALVDGRMRNLRPQYIQADEAWTFVQKKQKRLTLSDPEERGDQYVWLVLDSTAKLIMSWRVGKRDGVNAYEFTRRSASRRRWKPD